MTARFAGLRHLALLAVVGLLATTVLSYVWALVRTVSLADDLRRGGWHDDRVLIDLLGVIDLFLLATVQLIVALGLHELFVGDLDLPAWLEARSLDDLKKPLVDMLVVFVAVKGVEQLAAGRPALDTLASVGAVAMLIVALTLFRAVKTAPTGAVRPPQPPLGGTPS
jgi:uncharacterized membrane protein YqhA